MAIQMYWQTFFADDSHLAYTSRTKNGPKPTDFGDIAIHYSQPASGYRYLKKIVLPTERQTISTDDIFYLFMKPFSHVHTIEDNTSGALSILSPIRMLANGWVYGFSYQKALDSKGCSDEGTGIAPDETIRTTKEGIGNGRGRVLE